MRSRQEIIFAVIFLMMAFQFLTAQTVGDFAPLQVGNRWKYRDSSVSCSGTCTTSKSWKIINITSRKLSGTSYIYAVSYSDSTGRVTSTDSVIETKDGALSGGSSGAYFKAHLFPMQGGGVPTESGSIYGHAVINGQTCWIYLMVSAGSTANGSSVYYAQNIGLLSYSAHSSVFPFTSDSWEVLREFNGVALGSYTTVGVLEKPNNYRHPVNPNFGVRQEILGANRNALGRHLILKGLSAK